jgi:hypothetical protein
MLGSRVHLDQQVNRDHPDPQVLPGKWELLGKVDLRDNSEELELREHPEVQAHQDPQGPLELLVLMVVLVPQDQQAVLVNPAPWGPQDLQGPLDLLGLLEEAGVLGIKDNQETLAQQDFPAR